LLSTLEVTGVRNLHKSALEFHPSLNLIYGHNASGKTSLVEAISILASGKSFRTSSLENVITHGNDLLRVFGKTVGGDRLGFQWSKSGKEIRINGESVSRLSALAQALPLQSFTPETHIEFTRSRKHRIAVLDWLLFHVEPGFHESWTRYQRALAQRNAALKNNQNPAAWNRELAALGEQVVTFRRQSLEWLQAHIASFAKAIPGNHHLEIRIKQGWGKDRNLKEALEEDFERDRRDGFTHSGAHRSDLDIELEGRKIREEASQGQLKTLVMALRLSQLQFYTNQTGRGCIFILDDLPAELDEARRADVLSELAELPLQLFVTSTEPSLIDLKNWSTGHRLFHVEQGRVHVE
jgi:DNA replication and repair protein RecF